MHTGSNGHKERQNMLRKTCTTGEIKTDRSLIWSLLLSLLDLKALEGLYLGGVEKGERKGYVIWFYFN